MKTKLAIVVICLLWALPAGAEIITVDDAMADFTDIQAAIDYAQPHDTIVVYPGTYTGPGNRDIDFRGKALTLRSIDPNDPAVVANTRIDCQNLSRALNFRSGEGHETTVAGLTITRAKVTGANPKGGAIYCRGASPTIFKCTITGNAVAGTVDQQAGGGAIYVEGPAQPLFEACIISDNSALAGDGHSDPLGIAAKGRSAFAGAVYCAAASHVTLANCRVIANLAVAGNAGYSRLWGTAGGEAHGGAFYVDAEATLTILHSTIQNNTAISGRGTGTDFGYDGDAFGGAVACHEHGTVYLHNCLITGNQAHGGEQGCRDSVTGPRCHGGKAFGGAIYLDNLATALLAHCTIADNTLAVYNSSTYGSGVSCGDLANVTIENTIIWANTGAPQLHGGAAIAYCNIQGGAPGHHNISADPCFAQPARWHHDHDDAPAGFADEPPTAGDYHLLPGSPCIDAGDPDFINDPYQTDIDGEPRVITDRLDIGADEAGPVQADLNRDGTVDFVDLARLAAHFNATSADPLWQPFCDLSRDGRVQLHDLLELTNNWLWQAPWK